MRHPFDGIIVPQRTTRRSWLQGLFGVVAGLFGWSVVQAAAPPSRRKAGPEPSPEPAPAPKPTTKALKEEGALTRAAREAGKITTRAVGEEGGKLPPRATTLALNEEGARTTKALGEEGGARPKPLPRPTTLALGEEGGK